eukprot:Hpha_TRINITY_DN31914_c0_g1::TRINITY_DN31914_c0_g1_i1::g.21954::m.21954/K18726/FAF2, UBXD8; FAS-associated factor 2
MESLFALARFAGLGYLFEALPIDEELSRRGVTCQPLVTDTPSAAGDHLPLLMGTTFEEACFAACQASRFLLVYLHAPEHADTDSFCEQSLAADEFRTQVRTNYVLWAENVKRPEGYKVAKKLGATGYPYLCVLYAKSRTVAVPVLTVEGIVPVDELVLQLLRTQEDRGALLVAQRADQEERDQRRRVQEEQERSLEEARRIDLERAAEQEKRDAEAERERQEEAAKKEQEELEKARQEEEGRQHERKVLRMREEAKARVSEEPPAGKEATTLRVKLIDGKEITRRWLRTDKVEAVRDFIVAQECYDGQDFCVSPAFPPKELPLESTLEAAGLCPRAVVIAKELF